MKNKHLPPHLRRCSPAQKGSRASRFERLQDMMAQMPEGYKPTFIKMYFEAQGLVLIRDDKAR